MQTSWSNDAECLCCGDGGMLLLCDFCPASYHLECAGIEQVLLIFLPPLYKCCAITFPAQVPARKWMCPHHHPSRATVRKTYPKNLPPKSAFRSLTNAATASSGYCSMIFSLSVFITFTRADVRIVLFHFVKTANPTACRYCRQANVALLAK